MTLADAFAICHAPRTRITMVHGIPSSAPVTLCPNCGRESFDQPGRTCSQCEDHADLGDESPDHGGRDYAD